MKTSIDRSGRRSDRFHRLRRRAKWAIGFLLLWGMLSACPRSGLRTPPTISHDGESTLGPRDIFEVRVYGEEDLSGEYRVSPDGTIDFPYIGRFEVEGLESTQIADLISTRLEDAQVLVRPQVSVLVREYNSSQITVIGAVRSPGSFPLTPGLTVMQAIGAAGGFTDLADRGGTTMARQIQGQAQQFSIPVEGIMEGTRADLRVSAGDIITVPERPF